MARVFVTGSTQGVGRNAAEALLAAGHEVILHARDAERAETLGGLAARARVLTGDLASLAQTRALSLDLNAIGRVDAIIHNAGVMDDARAETPDGLPRVLMVNALAPYVLSLLADQPRRLIFTGSSMHRGHSRVMEDLEWTRRRWSGSQAYGESKLLVTALSAGLARRLPGAPCNTVDPGWVPTRMGGPSASDPLDQAHVTQCWLAASDDPAAQESGAYWRHMRRQPPDPKVSDPDFQDEVIARFAALSGVAAQASP